MKVEQTMNIVILDSHILQCKLTIETNIYAKTYATFRHSLT